MQRLIGTFNASGHVIEYSITGTKGEPVLLMHGGHSNCYEEFGFESLIDNDFMMITPSRAGYGETSKEIGTSLSKACGYYIELLDYLQIDKVHLLAISAGGPSGLYLASHYPERVKTLTLQSAVMKEWHTPDDKIYKIAQILFHPFSEKVTWKLTSGMTNLFPQFMFKQMTSSFSTLPYEQIKDQMGREDIDEVRKMNNRQRSGTGFLIDLLQTKDITANDLSHITTPTLIMHSKHDAAVSLEHAHYAHQQILESDLCILESWGHLIWIGEGSNRVMERMVTFLEHYENVS